MNQKTLYEHFKNSPKKLKIVCDWDEVVQATEPYALLKASERMTRDITNFPGNINFFKFFEGFWEGALGNEIVMNYSPYGSGLEIRGGYKELEREYEKVASSPDFYHQVPFLTIAEDLLRLIKEDKIERLIFLSTGDDRKKEVFRETFYKISKQRKRIAEDRLDEILSKNTAFITYRKDAKLVEKIEQSQFLIDSKIVDLNENDKLSSREAMIGVLSDNIQLRLMSDERKNPPYLQTKADWIKYNAKDFDVFIDDNPYICKTIIEANNRLVKVCKDCMKKYMGECHSETEYGCGNCSKIMNIIVFAPCYSATAKQHSKEVLLIKNEISDLAWKEN